MHVDILNDQCSGAGRARSPRTAVLSRPAAVAGYISPWCRCPQTSPWAHRRGILCCCEGRHTAVWRGDGQRRLDLLAGSLPAVQDGHSRGATEPILHRSALSVLTWLAAGDTPLSQIARPWGVGHPLDRGIYEMASSQGPEASRVGLFERPEVRHHPARLGWSITSGNGCACIVELVRRVACIGLWSVGPLPSNWVRFDAIWQPWHRGGTL
jgi:hypothetical protein